MSISRLFRIRPHVAEDAPEDKTVMQVVAHQAEAHGIELDKHGFPLLSSLEAWHRKNNPQLFVKKAKNKKDGHPS